jgi:hypothetical protein
MGPSSIPKTRQYQLSRISRLANGAWQQPANCREGRIGGAPQLVAWS